MTVFGAIFITLLVVLASIEVGHLFVGIFDRFPPPIIAIVAVVWAVFLDLGLTSLFR